MALEPGLKAPPWASSLRQVRNPATKPQLIRCGSVAVMATVLNWVSNHEMHSRRRTGQMDKTMDKKRAQGADTPTARAGDDGTGWVTVSRRGGAARSRPTSPARSDASSNASRRSGRSTASSSASRCRRSDRSGRSAASSRASSRATTATAASAASTARADGGEISVEEAKRLGRERRERLAAAESQEEARRAAARERLRISAPLAAVGAAAAPAPAPDFPSLGGETSAARGGAEGPDGPLAVAVLCEVEAVPPPTPAPLMVLVRRGRQTLYDLPWPRQPASTIAFVHAC